MKELFGKISDDWFLSEPLLFSVLCTHKLVEKTKGLSVPMRSGKMRIEYNTELLKEYSYEGIKEFLKFEIIRIILKHPYQRKPFNAHYGLLSSSSNFTIGENLNNHLYQRAQDVGFPPNLSFEEYYKLGLEVIQNSDKQTDGSKCPKQGENKENTDNFDDDSLKIENNNTTEKPQESEGDLKNTDDSDESIEEQAYENQEEQSGNNKLDQLTSSELEKLSALWEEDNLAESNINELIKYAQETNSWGSLSGNVVAMIEASLIIKIDYRKILNSFRASVISSQRKLTRMYPSRRYGFQFMGSKSDFSTKLLMAIDVSGSVTDEDLQNFFSVVNRFFKYGIKEIDVIQFDIEIKGELQPFKKAQKTIKIKGRGFTNFQPIFDYICDNPTYDGLLIFTDGGAPSPTLKRKIRTKILWVLDNEHNYNFHKHWIKKIPKSKAVWIP